MAGTLVRSARVFALLLCATAAFAQLRTARSVPWIDVRAFQGRYRPAFIKSTAINVDGVLCADVSYLNPTPLKFDFLVHRWTAAGLVRIEGTYTRTSTKPFLASQYSLGFEGAPSLPLWISMVGPVVNGQYEYYVYMSPDLSTVSVDPRDPLVFAAKYQDQVFAALERTYGLKMADFIDLRGDVDCRVALAAAVAKASRPAAAKTALSVPGVDLRAFSGRYRPAFVRTNAIPLAGVRCTEVTYTGGNALSFAFAANRWTNGRLERLRGTFARGSTRPFLASQYSLALEGAPALPLWVAMLGPVVRGKYEYYVYMSPDLSTVSIDPRDPLAFAEKYQDKVFAALERTYGLTIANFTDLRGDLQCLRELEDAVSEADKPPPVTLARSVPWIDVRAFQGRYRPAFIKSTAINVDGVLCADVSYLNPTPLKFDFLVHRWTAAGLVRIEGTYTRTSTKPFLASQYSLGFEGAPSLPLWISMVGPVVNGQYEYYVYMSPDLSTVSVDPRDPLVFAAKYQDQVFAALERTYGLKMADFIDLRGDLKCRENLAAALKAPIKPAAAAAH